MSSKHTNANIYVGCGPDKREGFLHVDIRKLPHVDIACPAWRLSEHFEDAQHIYSRHMLEHLTSMEAESALQDWHKTLKKGGTIRIIVPDLDYHIAQWLRAEWNDDAMRDKWSDARHGFAGLFGWQKECNPKESDYNQTYWDVHKSGYNKARMEWLLKRCGFSDIEVKTEGKWHLVANATKLFTRGERQIHERFEDVRADHRGRYIFAKGQLPQGGSVLDVACGIGYGSQHLQADGRRILGVDIEQSAVDHANRFFPLTPPSGYVCSDALALPEDGGFDAIVSFETIEHVPEDVALVKKFRRLLKKGGLLVCSTPNQTVMPFSKERFPYHVRHYTVESISGLLRDAGFTIDRICSQHSKTSETVTGDSDGLYLIIVARV